LEKRFFSSIEMREGSVKLEKVAPPL
jgi:hypothetical protein